MDTCPTSHSPHPAGLGTLAVLPESQWRGGMGWLEGLRAESRDTGLALDSDLVLLLGRFLTVRVWAGDFLS